jgi:hypothetical protein
MQASHVTHKLSLASRGGYRSIKVLKCDKKKYHLPLARADPWRGLGAGTPLTRAHWLVQNPKITLRVKKKFQSSPRDHGGPRHSLWHECKLQTQHTSSP